MANKRRKANRNANTRMLPLCNAKKDASKRAEQGEKLFFGTLVFNMFQMGSLRRTLLIFQFFFLRNFSANPKHLIGLSHLACFIHPGRSDQCSVSMTITCHLVQMLLKVTVRAVASPTSRGRFRRLVVKRR